VKGPGYDAIKGDNAQLVFAVASLCFSNSVENIFLLVQVDFNWRSFSSLPMRHVFQVPYALFMFLSQELAECWQIRLKILFYFGENYYISSLPCTFVTIIIYFASYN
jgi:hypothetical protein